MFTEELAFFSPDEINGRFVLGPQKAMINVGSVGQPRDGAVILMATEFDDETSLAKASLQKFAEDMLPQVQQQLNAIAAD